MMGGDCSASAASVCQSNVALARNTFVFLPAGGDGDDNGEGETNEKVVVLWGESFRIACCPELA